MARGETQNTFIGNLTADPDLRWTPNGVAVANFTVASTPQTFDRDTNEWKDGKTLFLRCNVWRDYAEHVSSSLTKGMNVVVVGRLKQVEWEKDGQKRTGYELDVDEVGPTLRWATAAVSRIKRDGGAGHPADRGNWNQQSNQQGAQQAQQNQAADPWGSSSPQGDNWNNEEPPF